MLITRILKLRYCSLPNIVEEACLMFPSQVIIVTIKGASWDDNALFDKYTISQVKVCTDKTKGLNPNRYS